MWKKVKPLLILLSVMLNVAFVIIWTAHVVPAHVRMWRGPAHEEGIWCPLHRRLAVTEAQWRKLEPSLVKFRESVRAERDKLNRIRGELIDLLASPAPAAKDIRAKQEEILARQKQMQQLVIERLLKEKQLLKPEQQEQLFQMLRSRCGCTAHGAMSGGMRGRKGRGPMNPARGSRP